jgi:hypothetical protein
MKKCSSCKEVLPYDSFNKSKNTKDGHQGMCRPCLKAYQKVYYSTDKEQRRLAKKRVLTRELVRAYIKEAKSVPCTDCGVKYPSYVMDFDHLGDKEFGIGTRAGTIPLERLKKEIAKCEVVCANCHRERTWGRDDESAD